MPEPQQLKLSEIGDRELVAALHVRSHVQTVAAGDVPHLAPALSALQRSHLGDVPVLYQRLLELIAVAEATATRLLVSYPDLKPRSRA